MSTTEERVARNEADIGSLKTSEERQWEIIEAIRKRLPVWATLLISLLTGAVFSLITVLTILCKNGIK